MKGNKMTLADKLESATDEEIVEAGKHLRLRLIKKFILGVVVSVAAHFASEALVATIENQKKNKQISS